MSDQAPDSADQPEEDVQDVGDWLLLSEAAQELGVPVETLLLEASGRRLQIRAPCGYHLAEVVEHIEADPVTGEPRELPGRYDVPLKGSVEILPGTARRLTLSRADEADYVRTEVGGRSALVRLQTAEAMPIDRAALVVLRAEWSRFRASEAAGHLAGDNRLAVPEPSVAPDVDPAQRASLVRQGGVWELEFEGERGLLRHRVGFEYVAVVVARPYDSFGALDLVGLRGSSAAATGTRVEEGLSGRTGPEPDRMTDQKTLAAVRAELGKLQSQARGAPEDEASASVEDRRQRIEELTRYLSQNADKFGRPRRAPGSAQEKARKNVSRALTSAYKELRTAGLVRTASHLESAIKRGDKLGYFPARAVEWCVDPG